MPETTAVVPSSEPDAEAFTELFHAHFRGVYVNLRRLGVPESAVDDALQEVFVVVLRRRAEVAVVSERAWILGISRRIADRWRRSAARQRRLAEALTLEPREAADGAAAVAQQQATRMLERFLADLDADKREVFVLAELEQLTAPEIAEALTLNINTVYSRLRAARQAFDRSFARTRLRDARATGDVATTAVLLSRARIAYAPGPAQQARGLAVLAALLVPGAMGAAGRLAAGSQLAWPAPAVAGKAAWAASFVVAAAVTIGVAVRVEEPRPRAEVAGSRAAATEGRVVAATRADEAMDPVPAAQVGAAPVRTRRAARTATAEAPALVEAAEAPTPVEAAPGPVDEPLRREAALLAEARAALRGGDAAGAQALLERHALEFPAGVLIDERRVSQISALCLMGQVDRARAEAGRLVRERPDMAGAVGDACGEFSVTGVAGGGD